MNLRETLTKSRRSEPWPIITQSYAKSLHFFRDMNSTLLQKTIILARNFVISLAGHSSWSCSSVILGSSRNVVLTQIWIAFCVYLLLVFLKFKAKIDLSMQQMIRLLQLNLFERRDLLALLKPPDTQVLECRQFSLF